MRTKRGAALACALAVALAAGCTGKGDRSSAAASQSQSPTASTTSTVTTAVAPTTVATVPPTTGATAAPTTTPPATHAPATSTAPTSTAAPRAQRLVVSATGYGRTIATFTAVELVEGHWRTVFGPWTANVGRNGFAPPGNKHEGDGRSPTGTFGLSFFFGINPNPGVRFEYRHITSTSIVWDDDPGSSNYNQWIDTRVAPAGNRPEPMYNAPVYNYGAVIAYNTARAPGAGSAIFLAVSHGAPTAGCVALPQAELLAVLRWLAPHLAPTITMGVGVT